MPIARNRRAARKAKTEGNLGVGGASSCVARNRVKGERERERSDTGGKAGQGKKKGDIRIAAKGWGPGAFVVAKRTDRWRGQEVREGGSRSPRGRTRVTTTRIRDTRVFCARTRYTYDAAQHGRVHRSARARCSVDRGRVYICLRVCVCVRARPPAS